MQQCANNVLKSEVVSYMKRQLRRTQRISFDFNNLFSSFCVLVFKDLSFLKHSYRFSIGYCLVGTYAIQVSQNSCAVKQRSSFLELVFCHWIFYRRCFVLSKSQNIRAGTVIAGRSYCTCWSEDIRFSMLGSSPRQCKVQRVQSHNVGPKIILKKKHLFQIFLWFYLVLVPR